MLYRLGVALVGLSLLAPAGNVAAGCVTHYYVANKSPERVTVLVWTHEKQLAPNEVGQFQYACHSMLPIRVTKLNGAISYYNAKSKPSIIPSDRKAMIDANFQYLDQGKTEAGSQLDKWLRALGAILVS